jgi:hypothetical protein
MPIMFMHLLADIKLETGSIRFIVFGFITIYTLHCENIKSVEEIGRYSIGPINAVNFKCRLFARVFLINLHRGWIARKIMITPKDPDNFIVWLALNNIKVSS